MKGVNELNRAPKMVQRKTYVIIIKLFYWKWLYPLIVLIFALAFGTSQFFLCHQVGHTYHNAQFFNRQIILDILQHNIERKFQTFNKHNEWNHSLEMRSWKLEETWVFCAFLNPILYYLSSSTFSHVLH